MKKIYENKVMLTKGKDLFLKEACIIRWKIECTKEKNLFRLKFDTAKTETDTYYYIQVKKRGIKPPFRYEARLRKGNAPKK